MGWGQGIGIGWPNASAGISYAKKLIKAFKERVLSYPNSIFEAEGCLDVTLAELNAIGLLKQTSLVITPNAYNEGVLYDVVPNTPLGDMDVVRATTATRVNELGLIEVVPRNLFTYSNIFSGGNWTQARMSITNNTQISPDGMQNASSFIEDTTLNSHPLYFFNINYIVGQSYTVSIFVKKGSRDSFRITPFGNGNSFFNLTTGTTPSSGATITPYSNGFYRCSVTFIAISANTEMYFEPVVDGNSFYQGDGSTSFYVYGAQLEQGSLTEYFPTTTRLNIPRLDYSNGSCPSLLVEPQRTNLVFPSEYTTNNATYTENNAISPSGNMDAFSFLPNVSTFSYIIFGNINSTQQYTFSIYLKGSVNGQKLRLYGDTNDIIDTFTLTTNWVRYTKTFTSVSGIQNIYLLSGNYFTPAENNLYYGYGAQLEQGSYATSYIPTVASSVTRNADIISKTGISSLIGQTEGVIYFENIVNFKNISSAITLQSVGNNSDLDFIALYIVSDTIYADIQISNSYAGGVVLGNISSLNLGDTYKLAIQYNPLGIKTYNNGVLINSSPIVISNYSKLSFKYPYGDSYINNKSTVLFKQYLTDSECIALTTL
jgi:hypothetical protein